MYRLLACALSSVIAMSGLLGPNPSLADKEKKKTHHAERPMKWDDTFLAARIFLGRLPAAMPGAKSDTPERVSLGRRLYFERGISLNKSQSCHDCHFLTQGRAGVDNQPTGKGATGTFGTRNSPTVINAGFQFRQFWDGRSADLAEQAKGPILNPIEMAIKTPEEAIAILRAIDGYPEAFAKAFPGKADPMIYDNLAEAIAAFERTLIAPSRFDRLLAGERKAMTRQEKRGLSRFIQYDCVECHSGPTAGGQHFRKIGRENPYTTDDPGRYDVTKKDEDRHVFKVPMLRNVTRTAPYFHNGQVATLKEAVRLMGWHQLNRKLTPAEIDDLIAFLGALEGNPPPVVEPR